ncbi:hypothetical protein ACS0TY_014126 [Phlomoides rotata]
MKETKDGLRTGRFSNSPSFDLYPLVLDIDDFKGDFSFDALFGNLVNELLPSYLEEETDTSEGHGRHDATVKWSFMDYFRGVDDLFDSFSKLDSLISSVGQTAAKIGDHLQATT